MRKFDVNKNDAGQRADKYVRKVAPLLPNSLLYKSFRTKRIKRNSRACAISDILLEGDVMELYLNNEFFEEVDTSFLQVPSAVVVVYEDENILVLNKPRGLLIHASEPGVQDTLQQRALHYLYRKGEYVPSEENSFAPAFLGRLDRNTSGLCLCAKNFKTLQLLSEKMRNREIKRYYLAEVVSTPNVLENRLVSYHLKDQGKNEARLFAEHVEGSKRIETVYRVLKSLKDTSMLEVEIITGKSHQIRAQLALIGHPVVGDKKYGYKGALTGGQRLCAYKLTFQFSKTSDTFLDYLTNKTIQLDA